MTKNILMLVCSIMMIMDNCIAQDGSKAPDDRGFVVSLGNMAPDFTIKFPDEKAPIKLSDLKGKVVMLQFTASWCSVCIKEMPHIEKDVWNKFKDKGLHIYGVDRKESADKVLKFAKKTKVSYPLILDEEGKIFEMYADENAGVTRNVLIDKDGKIVFMTRLFEENEFNQLVKKIEELLL